MTASSSEQHLARLAQIRDAAQQRAFISNTEGLPSQAFVEILSSKIRELLPRDLDLANVFAETNLYVASVVDTPLAVAYATRSRAQVLYTMRKCAEAEPFFNRAVELFEQTGMKAEVGRTLVGQIDNLMYLSRYSEALVLSERSRSALESSNDTQYLPTLEIALGNLYYRLNRYNESLTHYDRAGKSLESTDNYLAMAAVGLNRAHVLTEMNRFDEAVECFQMTKHYCERHGMDLWAAMADRGIAHMHFMRGNYSASLRILEQVRQKHEEAGDARRVGLCDMDRAEIYLELNLFEDAAKIAPRAFETFESLGNQYEAAKCLTYKGIAEFKLRRDKDAGRAFVSATDIFQKEGNEIWVAVLDLWRAQLHIRQQEFSKAQELAKRSAEVFEKQQTPVRAANAHILSAQSWQEMNQRERALEDAERALQKLEGYHAPWVSYQCYNTLGRLKELSGAFQEAEQLYLKAIDEMESLRGNIRLDELRMSFGRDKYQVYENIVNLKLVRGELRAAFQFVERSKSRTLMDLLEKNLETVWNVASDSPKAQRIRKIREELNILYSRLAEVGMTARVATAAEATNREIASRERELVELLRETGSEKDGWGAALQGLNYPTVDEIQGMLRSDETLVEYYAIGDRIHAFIVEQDSFRVVQDLTTTTAIRTSLKGLHFQLSKFHFPPPYIQSHNELLLNAMQHHLRSLYDSLIDPIKGMLLKPCLTIVPHHVLHYIPFQALFDGTNYLIDKYEIVYGASASVLKVCRERKIQNRDEDLVLAVPDELTPYINQEVQALRDLLPKARVFVGADARVDKLRQYGPSAGKLHIAAHGVFRPDNPMFSSLRLGDSWLNLFDIFNLQLGAELTTLSACETGMNAIWEGDELLGLARGFLYAGTPSLVVSLWTVNDRSTAILMRRFYEGLQNGVPKSRALQEAMIEVKERLPASILLGPIRFDGKILGVFLAPIFFQTALIYLPMRELKPRFATDSGLELERVYGPESIRNEDIGLPGEFPYTRGIQPTMYRGRLWTMRQYAGFGSAAETNDRFKYLLANGQTGLSVAFDLPTQIGMDSDYALAAGEVGKVGVAIDTLHDMEMLFNGIPLDRVSTSMTINATASILLAMYIAVAKKQGVSAKLVNGTIQNDILKEYIARGTYIYPPKFSLRLITDIFAYCEKEVPNWNTISISGYHIREAGSTAVQELAFTFGNAIAYVEAALKRGLNIDSSAPRLSFFFNTHNDFLEEIAKFRAARRMWARIARDRFGAKNPRSLTLRFHAQTAGSSLTAQQPDNNVVRVTIQALAAILGGAQSLHTNSKDEALSLPTADAARLALRTQQIIAYESGIVNTVDPVGGSYAIEALTDEIEEKATRYLEKIDDLGGMLAAIESGWVQSEIQNAAYEYQRSIEEKERIVVGVNEFQITEEDSVPIHRIDPSLEAAQIESLNRIRANRDQAKAKATLERLEFAATTSENLMPHILDAVEAYATIGEISDVFRRVHGEYQEALTV